MGICCRRRTYAFHGEQLFVRTRTVGDTLARAVTFANKITPYSKDMFSMLGIHDPKNILKELSVGFHNTNFHSLSCTLGGFDLWPSRHPATPTKHCWCSLGLFASHRYEEYLGRFLSRMLQHKIIGMGGHQKIILTAFFSLDVWIWPQ
jgi:hypothetical protein